MEVEESLFFDCKQWEPGVMPVQPSMGFLGKTGPQHSLSPDSLPYQFFCLFIPVYWWAKWTRYTNSKANMKKNGKSAESKSHWTDTCEAELKVWVASVAIWCIFKNLSFEAFF